MHPSTQSQWEDRSTLTTGRMGCPQAQMNVSPRRQFPANREKYREYDIFGPIVRRHKSLSKSTLAEITEFWGASEQGAITEPTGIPCDVGSQT